MNYKENPISKYKNTKFNVVDGNINEDILSDENLFLFENSNNTSFLNHLNLYNYIKNSSFNVITKTYKVTINFYPKILNRILVLL